MALRRLNRLSLAAQDEMGLRRLNAPPPLRTSPRAVRSSSAGDRAVFEVTVRGENGSRTVYVAAFDAGDGLQAMRHGDERDKADVTQLRQVNAYQPPAESRSLSRVHGHAPAEAVSPAIVRPAAGLRSRLNGRPAIDRGEQVLEIRD